MDEREKALFCAAAFGQAVLTAFALCVDVPAVVNAYLEAPVPSLADALFLLFQTSKGGGAAFFVLFAALLFFYGTLGRRPNPFLPSAAATAALFSAFLLAGLSYEALDSWDLLFGGRLLSLLSCLMFLGFFLFFYPLVRALFLWLDRARPAPEPPAASSSRLFLLYAGIILLCWAPYLLACYPGSMTYDGLYQLGQYFGAAPPTNHHPWLSTLLMGWIVALGRKANLSAGVFLYILCQSLACAAAFGASCLHVRRSVGRVPALLALAYFALVPTWGAYAQMFVKDTLFCGVFAVFFLCTVRFVQTRGGGQGLRLGLFLAGLSCSALRGNGLYIVVPTLFCLAPAAGTKRTRALTAALGAAVLALNLCLNQAVLPALGVAPGSVREMLSLPFQQTARYVSVCGGELAPEEAALIDRVLDYDAVASQYDPRVSDPVKNTYHGTPEALQEYLGFWLRCGLKRPDIYLDAALNSMFGYFLPGYRYGPYGGNYFLTQEPAYGLEVEFAHPNAVRAADGFSRLWSVTPGLLLLNAPGTYSWLLVLCSAALLRRKKLRELLAALPLWLALAINCISPVNGLVRYSLPIMAAAPLLISLTWTALAQAEKGGVSADG